MGEDMEMAERRLREAYGAFSRGDFEAAAAFVHPEMVFNRVAEFEQPLEGRDAFRANLEPEIFSNQEAEVLETEIVGDCVIARAAFHAKGAGSGIEMTDEAWHLWRMKDGMAIEFRYFAEREEAIRAAQAPS